MAKGDIVCVINSDDPFFVNNAITSAVDCLNQNADALMAYPDWVCIDEYGSIVEKKKLPQYTLQNMIESAVVCLGPGMFIKKDTLEKIGPRDQNIKYTGDLDYSFKIVSKGKIVHIPLFLATHRVHSKSLSNEAKGILMAKEVANIGETYINHPSLPEETLRNKRKILAKWYLNAMFFVGADLKGIAFYLFKSIKESPLTTSSIIIDRVFRRLIQKKS